jgi:two-component system LytT family sensor kinase
MTFKSFIKFILASIAISIGVNLINAYNRGSFLTWEQELELFGINLLFAVVLSVSNQAWFEFMTKKYSWQEHTLKRVIWGALGGVTITMVSLFLLNLFISVVIYKDTWKDYISSQSLGWYVFGLVITLVITLIYHAVFFFKLSQAKKVNDQKVIARSATAQFDALKNQLDPHFLFNSLNVLVSLIEENPKAATKFTTSLSKVYRYVLEQRNKELISIDEELNFARSYVGLLKTRFEDSIEIEIPDQGSSPEAKVVPLSLQLLIENAVKHNVVSDSKPLKLRIYEQDNLLIIENNLQKKQVIKKSSGVGLQNIAGRYRLLTDRRMSIEETTTSFKVHLPILTNQPEMVTSKTNEMETLEDIRLIKAKEHVAGIKEFYDSAIRTIMIIAFLAAINSFTGGFPWVVFPAIGMGIGLFFKYLKTYNKQFLLSKKWEEDKITNLMNNEKF